MFQFKKSYSLEKSPSTQISACSQDNTDKSCYASTDEIVTNTKLSSKYNSFFLGLFYCFLTSFFITLTNVFVKMIPYISPSHLSLVRNIGVLAGCLPIAIYKVRDVLGPKKDRGILLLRGFLGGTSLYLNLTAYRYLPIAEAAVLMSIVPALTTVVAYFYLKEPCGRGQILCIFMSICGVLLSVRLPELLTARGPSRFNSEYLAGLASGMGCVVIMVFVFVTLRKMKNLHFTVPLIYFGFCGMIENTVIDFISSASVYPRCGLDQILIMLIGVFGLIGHCALALAIQTEAVGIMTVAKSSLDIVIALVFQIIFFSDKIDIYNITGALLVMGSVSMLGFNKWLLTIPEDSKGRKIFACLL